MLAVAALFSSMQVPIGLEEHLKGLVSLIDRTAYYFEGRMGEEVGLVETLTS